MATDFLFQPNEIIISAYGENGKNLCICLIVRCSEETDKPVTIKKTADGDVILCQTKCLMSRKPMIYADRCARIFLPLLCIFAFYVPLRSQ
jgi:hypothetical protein